MKTLYMRLVLPVLALIMATAGAVGATAQDATPAAGAAESRSITFYPEETGHGSFISVELNPGESTEVDVVVGNTGNVDQELRTYAINALSSMNGGFVLDEYGADPVGVTSWLDYPEQNFKLAAGEGVVVPVIITVPEDATPGEYVTGLAAEQADSFDVPGSGLLKQRVRWSVPILVDVPGERQPAFELGDAELEWIEGDIVATVNIANTGNVILEPTGQLRLMDTGGTVVGVSEVEIGSLYSGTETIFVAGWRDVPQSDTYSVQVMLAAEDGTATVEKEYTDLVPLDDESTARSADPLYFAEAELVAVSRDTPPTVLQFDGVISNAGSPIQEARVSIVTYKDGEEIDRYPIMQAVTLSTGETPVEARYSLPGGFTDGTYTFEVTIEVGSGSTQTVLATQPLEYSLTNEDLAFRLADSPLRPTLRT